MKRFEKDATELTIEARWEDVRAGAYDPQRYLDENARDGVMASVLYPSEALLAYGIPDSALCSATMRAYNDFIADFCSEDPGRLKGCGLPRLKGAGEGDLFVTVVVAIPTELSAEQRAFFERLRDHEA